MASTEVNHLEAIGFLRVRDHHKPIATPSSASRRILLEHLGNSRDVIVGILSRPQASLTDFYRGLGHLFSVPLAPHNRKYSINGMNTFRMADSPYCPLAA